MKDTQWATQTCTLGWTVRGVWQDGHNGTDIDCLDVSFKNNLIVAGDDFGNVLLFNYPTWKAKAAHKKFKGHSAHVKNVTFSADGERVFSAGGRDMTIIQWKLSSE
eukprot:GEZU01006275.1.p1 GENE.GEZU01006275.1~~GEZU01006275.1.p1  ORF type:complete len:106 (+),score=32.77 GEZU01006275.1:171-488(+)